MVSLTALWLPIALSAVAVFVASSIIHMVFRYHNSEYRQLPDEGAVLAAMRSAGISPGFYSFPYAASLKEMGSPEMMEKYKQGPMGTANINPNGPPAMGNGAQTLLRRSGLQSSHRRHFRLALAVGGRMRRQLTATTTGAVTGSGAFRGPWPKQ